MMRCDGDMTAVVEEWAVVGKMHRSLAALGMTAGGVITAGNVS